MSFTHKLNRGKKKLPNRLETAYGQKKGATTAKKWQKNTFQSVKIHQKQFQVVIDSDATISFDEFLLILMISFFSLLLLFIFLSMNFCYSFPSAIFY